MRVRWTRVTALVVLGVGLLVAGVARSAEVLGAKQATSQRGMVAAAHPLAAQAGVDMLLQGGNAFDAATAAAFALTVVEPFASSLGGDGTSLLYHAKTDSVAAFDYRCEAPAKASYETLDFSDKDSWGYTLVAPGVPGMVAGTCAMHKKRGRLPLATVMAPAIRYAEDGFAVLEKLASLSFERYSVLEAHEEAAKLFLDDGLPLDVGTHVRNPDLAKSLRMIAEQGPDAFYKGEIAQRIDAFMRANGGLMRASDLAAYRARETDALRSDYRGYRVWSAPPPFGGLAVLQNLNVITQLGLDFNQPATHPKNIHLMAEAMKGVSRDRSRTMGDPRFVEVPVKSLLSKEYAIKRAKTISGKRAVPPGDVIPTVRLADERHGSTSHLSVVDSDGNAVALTQTLGHFFGSGVMVPGTGILLNDQMRNFFRTRSSPNSLRPGKRMRSTQAPTIVTRDGKLILVTGSPGNYRIITTVVEILINFLDYGMTLQEAVDAPRFTSRHSYPTLQMESRFPAETVEALKKLGHKIETFGSFDLYFGGAQAIARDPASGLLTGVADKRRDGVALGLPAGRGPGN